MIKIGILNKGPNFNWGKNFGYWFFVKFFQNELKDAGYDIKFYDSSTNQFYNSDAIIIDSRIFTDTIENKIRKKINLNVEHKHLESIIEISKKNQNIIWLDLTDSSGTTSFEVLPYVKNYVKKQFYMDKDLYKLNLFRGRYYADFYQKNFQLEENFNFKFCPLSDEYKDKLVLGWNIGVGNYFNIFKFNKLTKYQCILSSLYKKNYKELLEYTLGYYNDTNKSQNIFYRFNLRNNDKKKTIHFQRNKVNKILNDRFNLPSERLDHKSYLRQLRNSKISVGAFGWGEVCYREFEAIKMGAAVIFPNVNYLETWPNIYQDNVTYISYNLDFSDLHEKIDLLLNNDHLRKNIIENSQNICKKVYSSEGFNYLLNFFGKISR